MTIQIVERITLGRYRPSGIDWGTERILLAESPEHALYWWKSHKAWTNRTEGTTHRPGELCLATPGVVGWADSPRNLPRNQLGKILCEGGRLSKAMLMDNRDAIDAAFGEGVTEQLSTRHTVLVDMPEKA